MYGSADGAGREVNLQAALSRHPATARSNARRGLLVLEAGVDFTGSTFDAFDDQLADDRTRDHPKVEKAMVDQFQRDPPLKTAVNGWRGKMHGQTDACQRASTFNARGKPRVSLEVYRLLGLSKKNHRFLGVRRENETSVVLKLKALEIGFGCGRIGLDGEVELHPSPGYPEDVRIPTLEL